MTLVYANVMWVCVCVTVSVYVVVVWQGPMEEWILPCINIFEINKNMPSKVQDEMTYPFPNLKGATVEVW